MLFKESSLFEELSTFVHVTISRDTRLQVPFPSLNKALPSDDPSTCPPSTHKLEADLVDSSSDSAIRDITCQPASLCNDQQVGIDWKHNAEKLLAVLLEAVNVRVKSAPSLPSCQVHKPKFLQSACSSQPSVLLPCPALQCTSTEPVYGCAKVGVLFSGGVDSVVLAALVDRYNPLSSKSGGANSVSCTCTHGS